MQEQSNQPQVIYHHVSQSLDFQAAKELFVEYSKVMHLDLGFQDFADELKALPDRYSGPKGDLILATVGDQLAGSVAVHEFKPSIAEMKRLYVRDAFRHLGIGQELVARILVSAKSLGYQSIRLDTLDKMQSAIKLYEAAGFKNIQPYRFNPLAGAEFMEYQF